MSSLTSCLRRAGPLLDAEDRTAIVDAARMYRADGMPADEAARRAVEERLQGVQRELETALLATVPQPPAAAPAVAPAAPPVPVPEVRELTVDQAETLTPSPRETELTRLRDATTDAEVRKDLERQITAERKRATDTVRGEEYLRLADEANDPQLKADLEAKAKKLGVSREIPTGSAVEVNLAEWRAAHGLGTLDGERGVAVTDALEIDDAATRAAVVQFQSSPRAFDRQIDRIIEQGAQRESQSEEAAGGSGRPAAAPGGGAGSRSDGAEGGDQGRAVGEVPSDPQAEGQASQVAAARAAFERATEPTGNPVTDAFSQRLRADYEGAVREYEQLPDSEGGSVLNADLARELSPDYVADRTLSSDVHGPASAFIGRLYAEKLSRATPPGKDREVLITAGGTGAGKSSGLAMLDASLKNQELTYDTTMSKMTSAVDKIDPALDAGRGVVILYTYANPLDAIRQALLRAEVIRREFGTGRTVPIGAFISAHTGASRVIRDVADLYRNDQRVQILAVDNSRGKGKQQFADLAELPPVADNRLREQAEAIARELVESGEIDRSIFAGFFEPAARRSPQIGQPGLAEGVPRRAQQGAERGSGQDRPTRLEPSLQGPVGASTFVVTERGMRVPVRYRVIELDDLVTSHTDDLKVNPAFPQQFQPRDRTRAASEAQIAKIANAINPALLADSYKAGDGAPIIWRDAIVESGNARTIALRRAYRAGNAGEYRDWLADNAERFGLTAEQVRGAAQPVLVRERTVKVDRADFARQANESPVAEMSDSEQAIADAQMLPDLELLVTNDDGSISIRRSPDFIHQFMREIASDAARGKMMTEDGSLSQHGAARIRNAVFAKAYGDPELVSMLTETTDGNVKNLLAGLLRAAPGVARVRELADAGARGDAAFVPDLIDAVRRFSDLRADGMTVSQYLSQGSLIGGEAPERVADLLRQLELDSRAPRRVADMVQRLVDRIDAAGDPRQSGMFDESTSD